MPDVLECRKNVQKEECAIKRNETDPRDRQYEPDPSEQAQKRRKKAKKPNRGLRVAAVLLTIVLALEGLYCFVVFTDIPAIKSLREAYIETAMNTLSHQWLAKWFLPSYMIDEVVARQDQARKDQEGKISTWDKISASDATDKNGETVAPTEPTSQTDEERFYELFWELDRISFEDYVSAHPDVTANGWDNIYINEAGLNDDGTDIYTAMGERVLAVDAKNKILLVRVEGSGYQGVLAIAKDPSQLYNAPSAYIGSWGQQLEAIASAHDAVLGMTGSGFIDPDGNGSGGELAGYAMSQGESYGEHYVVTGYKRVELRESNLLYVTDASAPVAADTTDAVEFWPALVVDGEPAVENYEAFNGIQPRACIGQSEKKEILMLVIGGPHADPLLRHDDRDLHRHSHAPQGLSGPESGRRHERRSVVRRRVCDEVLQHQHHVPHAAERLALRRRWRRPIIFRVPFCCMPRACSSFFGFCGICPGKPCRMAAFCPEACRNPR